MKKIVLIFSLLFMLMAFFGCSDVAPISAEAVDKTALISLLEDFERIPQTLDQATLVTAYSLVREDEFSTQKEVNDAVLALKELKETIFATPMTFIDGGVEPHVRAALGFDDDTQITIGDCFALKELDCTYDADLGKQIRVSYDFRYFPNLKVLNLTGNSIEDLNGLAYLSDLVTLSLADNPVRTGNLTEEDNMEDVRSFDVLGTLSIQHLDLSGTSVLSSIKTLPKMEGLVSLDVSGNQLSSFDGIGERFPKLQTLVATDCGPSDLTGIGACATLVSLDISRTGDSNLLFLPYLENLISLTMDEVPVSDYVSITKVPRLNTLSLSGCGISEVSWLSGFSNLEELDLSKNNITDLSSVVGEICIQKLDLAQNTISGFVLNEAFASVEELSLSGNQLTAFSVNASGNIYSLKVLDLSSNAITDLSVEGASRLESLNLSRNALSVISLRSDTLLALSLSGNPLTELSLDLPSLATLESVCEKGPSESVVLNLPALKVLDLSGTFTFPVDTLMSLKTLESLALNLSGNTIYSFADLSSLKSLTLIGCDDQTLSSVSALNSLESLTVSSAVTASPQISGLKCLKSLAFDSCESLSDLSGLRDLDALESLSVTGGSVSAPNISSLPSLRALIFSQCGVRSLSSVSDIPMLESISLRGNGIQTIEVLGFERLKYLDLSNNQLSTFNALALDMTTGILDLSENEESLYSELSSFPNTLKIITER